MWRHRRSAPEGVLFAGALVLLGTATGGVLFYTWVVRAARGLPVYSAGVLPASLAHAAPNLRAYDVLLAGPEERRTPAGTRSAAHRWVVRPRAAPARALCSGEALDGLLAVEGSAQALLALPPPESLWVLDAPSAVPAFLLATCPGAQDHDAASLEYEQRRLEPDAPATVVACASPPMPPSPLPRLGVCEDGAPSRVYPREAPARARARVRAALRRVCYGAALFALSCFLVGLAVLRRFAGVIEEEREP